MPSRFRPVNPMTYDASDDEANNAYTTKNPLERLLGVYKKKTTFNQNYNAGVNWKPSKLSHSVLNSVTDGSMKILIRFGMPMVHKIQS